MVKQTGHIWAETCRSPPHRLSDTGNDSESNKSYELDLVRKQKLNKHVLLPVTEHVPILSVQSWRTKMWKHNERIQNGQRSRAKLRTCQDSAAIPACDESRTGTLTTCHGMSRCTTSSNVELIELIELIELNKLRHSTTIYKHLWQSTKMYDNLRESTTDRHGVWNILKPEKPGQQQQREQWANVKRDVKTQCDKHVQNM